MGIILVLKDNTCPMFKYYSLGIEFSRIMEDFWQTHFEV